MFVNTLKLNKTNFGQQKWQKSTLKQIFKNLSSFVYKKLSVLCKMYHRWCIQADLLSGKIKSSSKHLIKIF